MNDGKEVDTKSLIVEGVFINDYPDFADAFFSYGEYTDGTPIPDAELEKLTAEQGVFLNEFIHNGQFFQNFH